MSAIYNEAMWFRLRAKHVMWAAGLVVACVASGLVVTFVIDVVFPSHAAATLTRVAARPTGCASSKQYLVEFRVRDDSPQVTGLRDRSLDGEFSLTVDGDELGKVPLYAPGMQRFLCEGNHEAIVQYYTGFGNESARHRVLFAVSRPSLFHATEWARERGEAASCIGETDCSTNVGLELSPLDPEADRAERVQRMQTLK